MMEGCILRLFDDLKKYVRISRVDWVVPFCIVQICFHCMHDCTALEYTENQKSDGHHYAEEIKTQLHALLQSACVAINTESHLIMTLGYVKETIV